MFLHHYVYHCTMYTKHFVYSTIIDIKHSTFYIQYNDVVVLYNVQCKLYMFDVLYKLQHWVDQYLHAMLHDSVF